MSYPAEDRHERDVVGGPARNPSQDVEKHDKSKVLSANPGGILLCFYFITVVITVFRKSACPVSSKRFNKSYFGWEHRAHFPQHFCNV